MLFVNLGLKEQTLLAAAVYDEAMEEMHKVSQPITARWAVSRGVFPVVVLLNTALFEYLRVVSHTNNI